VFRVDADEPFVLLPHFADPKKAVQFVEGASLSADGALAATAGSDGALATWDVAKGREVERIAAHKMMIEAFAASADGRYGLTGSRDGRARLWQLSPLHEIATRPGHDGPVRSLVASPDGARLWSAGADGRVLEWTLARPGELAGETTFDARKPDPTGWARTALGTFARGGTVVVALDTRRVWATDRLTGRTLWDRELPEVVYLFPPVVGGSAVAANALILDLESGAQVMTIGGAGEFHALSPDGRLVAVGDDEGALWLADARSGARVRALAGHGSAQTFVAGQGLVTVPHATVEGGAFRTDGAVLVTTGGDHTARFWRVSTGEALGAVALSSTSSPPRAVAFSPDGRRVVVCEEETGLVRVVDGASFREVAVLNLRTDARLVGARPRSVAFSPDGRSVYVGTSRGPIAVIAVP